MHRDTCLVTINEDLIYFRYDNTYEYSSHMKNRFRITNDDSKQ